LPVFRSGKERRVDHPDVPDQPEGESAEERTTDEAAGAPAGDRDLEELQDDADPASD
jgi:hypothetical protein